MTHHTYIFHYYFTEIKNAENKQPWNSECSLIRQPKWISDYIYIE